MRTVKQLFNMRKAEGDAGVEIEVEGVRLPIGLNKYWRVEHDGSLRGPENREYVMKKPGSMQVVRNALRFLEESYQDLDSDVHETVRAGVHVHVNCQQMNIVQVYNFITIYMCFEELMVEYCGEFRQGNLFCLRSSDAEYLPMFLALVARKRDWNALHTDRVRYGSINVMALRKYGSLEFRAMRGTRDFDVINTWVEMLLKLRDAATQYQYPSQIISELSRVGAKDFLNATLGNLAGEVNQFEEVEMKIYKGVRLAQDVAFSTDWEAVVQEEEEFLKRTEKGRGAGIPDGWIKMPIDPDFLNEAIQRKVVEKRRVNQVNEDDDL